MGAGSAMSMSDANLSESIDRSCAIVGADSVKPSRAMPAKVVNILVVLSFLNVNIVVSFIKRTCGAVTFTTLNNLLVRPFHAIRHLGSVVPHKKNVPTAHFVLRLFALIGGRTPGFCAIMTTRQQQCYRDTLSVTLLR